MVFDCTRLLSCHFSSILSPYNIPQTFEGEVRCLGGTEVRQTVNGLDLSLLARRVTEIQQRLAAEKQRFRNILSQFGSLNEDNYVKARGEEGAAIQMENLSAMQIMPSNISYFHHLL